MASMLLPAVLALPPSIAVMTMVTTMVTAPKTALETPPLKATPGTEARDAVVDGALGATVAAVEALATLEAAGCDDKAPAAEVGAFLVVCCCGLEKCTRLMVPECASQW